MRSLSQSTSYDLMVFMVDANDHRSGKTGLSLTILASKAGGAFGAITPTVTERDNGWYALALTASHTDTLGDLALHITGAGADTKDIVLQVDDLAQTIEVLPTRGQSFLIPVNQARHRVVIQGATYGTGALDFTARASDGGQWPTDLSTYTWVCHLVKATANTQAGTATLNVTPTVTTATGSARKLSVPLTATQTAAFAIGDYTYQVVGTSGSIVWESERGTISVLEDYT